MEKVSETTLVVERIIDASAEKVFKALTEESQLRQWFYPIERGFSVKVAYEVSIGGNYKIDMIDPNGSVYEHQGVIRDLVPNKKLVFTWSSHVVENTLVTIRLKELELGTKITLTHEFRPADKVEGHKEGWNELFENLNVLLTEV